MANRAKTSLPHPEPCQSYWQQPPHSIADLRSSGVLPEHTDVVIIGSGISGAAVAYNLLIAKSDLKIVMLEARQAASGASGRNGGHTKTATYRSFLENVAAVGEEEAIKISKLEYDCMAAVHAFINEKGIECDGKRCDTVDIFYDQGHLDDARKSVELMDKLIGSSHPTSKHTFFNSEDTKKLFYTENSLGSIKYEAGSLSAYKFTIEVLKLGLDMGLNLQTNTPATGIAKSGNQWNVETPRGQIRTPTILLATNGYTAALLPQLQDVIVPFRGVVTAQRPGQSLPRQGDFQNTYSFVYKEGYEYMITRPAIKSLDDEMAINGHASAQIRDSEYDIIIGGGLTKTADQGSSEFYTTDDSQASIPETIHDYLKDCTAEFYGSAWGKDSSLGTVRKLWSGIMGYSADDHPFVGPYPEKEGLWLDASFQGHGMVLCWLCAKAVSQMMLGSDEQERLNDWFPQSFRVTQERLKKTFSGRITGRTLGEAESVNGQSGVNN